MQGTASNNAPDYRIITPHFMIGAVVILLAVILLFFNPDSLTSHFFNAHLLALTHLVSLGWITMIIFGALYQLIPVILETRLFSETMAIISLLLLITGTILITSSFWYFNFGFPLLAGGSIILFSVILFVANLLGTSLQSEKKTIEKKFIVTSSIWLLLTCMAGLTLAFNFTFPFLSQSHLDLLKIHAHAGLVGWFIQLIIGVGSKLLPMFMVAHGMKITPLKIAYPAINSGLIIALISEFFVFQAGVITGIILTLIGILSFLFFLADAYRLRVRKNLDPGMKQSAIAFFALLIPIVLIVLIFAKQKLHTNFITIYGFILITGFITSLILGQTYKTLPFIIWLKEYRGKMGKSKIPLPKDLYTDASVLWQTWLFTGGFIIVATGVMLLQNLLIQAGAGFMISGLIIYNFNIFKIIFHKSKN